MQTTLKAILQFTHAHTKDEEMRILPPQPVYNFSFQNMLLKQCGYILWSNISIPIDLKKKRKKKKEGSIINKLNCIFGKDENLYLLNHMVWKTWMH